MANQTGVEAFIKMIKELHSRNAQKIHFFHSL